MITSITATEAENIVEPVTLEEVKRWARVDYEDDDELLTEMIPAAREAIERETNLKLVPHTVTVGGTLTRAGNFLLPYGTPTVTAVTLIDGEEDTALSSLEYQLRGRSLNVYGYGDYVISYTVGTTVSAGLKEAIKMLVAYRYNNRGDQEKQTGMPEDILRRVIKHAQIWV